MIHLALLRLVSPGGRGVLAGVLVGLVLSALALLQALATAQLFTGILGGAGLASLVLPFALLAAALLLRPLATTARELVAHGVASRMKRALRARILDHETARGPFAAGGTPPGARHALLIDGVEHLEPYVTRYLPQVIVTAVTAAVTVTLLVFIDPVVGMVAGAVALIVPLVPRLWDRVLRGRGEEHWNAYSSMHGEVADAMRGMETLKLLGAEGRRRDELANGSRTLLHATLRQLQLSLVESGLTGFLLVAGPAIALATGVARVAAGALEPLALFAVTLIAFEVFRPFRDLAAHWHAGYAGVMAGRRLLDELVTPVAPDAAPSHEDASSRSLPRDGLAIELHDVRARYPGAERPSLDGVSLDLPRGSITAIVGPSGGGKSTLANVILGLLTPERGRLAVIPGDGVAPVSLVSQDPVLFAGTLRENLAVVAPHGDDAAFGRALERAEAGELLLPPHGLDAQLGDGGSLLSGGQRQRVAIARALLRESPILVLDEASSALDAQREHALLARLRAETTGNDARAGSTIVVIAHRLSAIRDVDRIVVLDGGRIVEQGGYDELCEAGGTFARLHAAQAEQVGA